MLLVKAFLCLHIVQAQLDCDPPVVAHFDLAVKIFAAYERLAKAAFLLAFAVPQFQVHVAQRGVALVRVDINVKAEVAHAGDVDGLVTV